MSKFYAQLNENNIVVGVSQLNFNDENPAPAHLVEIQSLDESLLNQEYDSQGGTFSVIEQVAAPIRDITKGSFYGRLTLAEQIALETSTDPVIKIFEKRLNYRTHVNLDFPELTEGLDYMVQQGLLQPERIAELRADGTEAEKYSQ